MKFHPFQEVEHVVVVKVNGLDARGKVHKLVLFLEGILNAEDVTGGCGGTRVSHHGHVPRLYFPVGQVADDKASTGILKSNKKLFLFGREKILNIEWLTKHMNCIFGREVK